MSKTLNAHNFLNIDRKILILDFRNISLIQGIQLKNIFAVPLNQYVTTTQNDENLDVFDSDSLHILQK